MDYTFEKGKFSEEELELVFIELQQKFNYGYASGETIYRHFKEGLLYDDLKNICQTDIVI